MADGNILSLIAQPQVANVVGQFGAGQETGRINRLRQQAQQVGQLPAGQQQNEALRRLGTEAPETATKINELFAGLDQQNITSAAFDIAGALSVGGEQQTALLRGALPKVASNNLFTTQIQEMLNLPQEQRDERLINAVQTFQGLGILPGAEKATKTAGQIEREIKVTEAAQATREAELVSRAAEQKRQASKLSATTQKILDGAQEAAVKSSNNAASFDVLAGDFDRLEQEGGVITSLKETFKELTGTEDAISDIRRKYNAVRASQAMTNLPPGPASDKDIALALSGFPKASASGPQIARFMRGVAKAERINTKFLEFKAGLISEQGNTKDLIPRWKEFSKNLQVEETQDIAGQAEQQGGDIKEGEIVVNPQDGRRLQLVNGEFVEVR